MTISLPPSLVLLLAVLMLVGLVDALNTGVAVARLVWRVGSDRIYMARAVRRSERDWAAKRAALASPPGSAHPVFAGGRDAPWWDGD